jgi:hypothetical protein
MIEFATKYHKFGQMYHKNRAGEAGAPIIPLSCASCRTLLREKSEWLPAITRSWTNVSAIA